MKQGVAIVIVAAAALFAPAALADRAGDALATSQGALGQTLPDLRFIGTEGQTVTLSQLQGKPALLTLIYTGCADVCPAVIESLAPAVDAAEEALGKDSFNVVTVGFDTRNDTPARMRSFARQHNAGGGNWHFVSADQATLDRLSQAVGFSYYSTAGGFEHMAQVSVIDKQGAVYRQIYGSTFDTPQIVEPLKELVFGRERPFLSVAGIMDRVKLFCTVYNPNTGRYYFNYSLFFSIFIGLVSLSLVLYVLVRETRKAMRSGGAS